MKICRRFRRKLATKADQRDTGSVLSSRQHCRTDMLVGILHSVHARTDRTAHLQVRNRSNL